MIALGTLSHNPEAGIVEMASPMSRRQPPPKRLAKTAEREGCASSTEVEALRKALATASERVALRERQLAELNHRIANTFQIVGGLIRVQKRVCSPSDDARRAFEAIELRVQAIADLHRGMCRLEDTECVDLAECLVTLAASLETIAGVRCAIDAEPIEMPGETALQLVMCVSELALNARKHAYGDRKEGDLTIRCRRDGHTGLLLTVADRGPGLPRGFEPNRAGSLGMRIVTATVDKLGGRLQADTRAGARFTLFVPLR